jgi:polyisoprenoid-binding protein YceI
MFKLQNTNMKKIMFFIMMGIVTALSAFAPSSHTRPTTASSSFAQTSLWTIDKPHTNVKFTVAHLVISDVDGNFKSYDGSMESSKTDFSDAKITFTADVNSINTDNDMRDNHLKSDDFLNAAKFPQIKFVSTSFTPQGDNKYSLVGNLTIRDVTKSVTFDVKYGGTVVAMGGTHAGFKATTKIDRFDYNLKWSKATEAGGLVAGKEVEITINVDFKKS